MKVTTIIISVLLLGIFVAGFQTFLDDAKNNYNLSYSNDDMAKMNKINQTYAYTVEIGSNFQGINDTFGQEGVNEIGFTTKVLKSISVFWNSIKIIPDAVTSTTDVLGLPDWLKFSFLAIVILVIIWSLLVLFGIVKGGTA